jgi:hypothetical protein
MCLYTVLMATRKCNLPIPASYNSNKQRFHLLHYVTHSLTHSHFHPPSLFSDFQTPQLPHKTTFLPSSSSPPTPLLLLLLIAHLSFPYHISMASSSRFLFGLNLNLFSHTRGRRKKRFSFLSSPTSAFGIILRAAAVAAHLAHSIEKFKVYVVCRKRAFLHFLLDSLRRILLLQLLSSHMKSPLASCLPSPFLFMHPFTIHLFDIFPSNERVKERERNEQKRMRLRLRKARRRRPENFFILSLTFSLSLSLTQNDDDPFPPHIVNVF